MVKLSQDPSFGEGSNGVRITVVNLHSNLDYADLNITYPNGVPGGHGAPAGLPSFTNEVRVLFVPVRLSGGSGVPTWATNGWFERLMFNETNGPDARNVANSTKKYFEQNTYGHVRITGDIYPQWVTVGTARTYTSSLVWTIPEHLVHDTSEGIKALTPHWFETNKYKFVIIVMPGELSPIYGSYEQSSLYWDDPDKHFAGYLTIDLPLEVNSRLMHPITNEVNTVSNAIYVQPEFLAYRLQGVWLADDTNHTGVNYFSGGSVNVQEHNIITLGTPVPSGKNVIVDYAPDTSWEKRTNSEPFFSIFQVDTWYGSFLHELTHGLGSHITFTDTEYIADLYPQHYLIQEYSLMATGGRNYSHAVEPYYNDPAYFDAFMKACLGVVSPYELRYGENETLLRLYASEEFPYTSRTKLIKVPLHPDGYQARRQLHETAYVGEEYLLLELRKKGAVSGIHNFDNGLPYQGVFVYHASDSYGYYIGDFWEQFARIMDVTPAARTGPLFADPIWNMELSLFATAPSLGFDSGIFQYVHGSQWQSINDSNLTFRLEREGVGKIYAKFGDGQGNESPVTSADVTFSPWPDTNGNHIDDNWELKFFNSLTSTNGTPTADPDGDGMSNLQEFLAGTNPTNKNNGISVTFTNGEVWLHVPTTLGVPYIPEYSRELAHPRWISFFSSPAPLLGSGTTEVWKDYNRLVGDTRFYRLRYPEH